MQEVEMSLFIGTKEKVTETLQPHEVRKLMASGVVDFKSRRALPSQHCPNKEAKGDGVMESGKGTNSSLMMGL